MSQPPGMDPNAALTAAIAEVASRGITLKDWVEIQERNAKSRAVAPASVMVGAAVDVALDPDGPA